jgi:broad specificity phosphatase PhoE
MRRLTLIRHAESTWNQERRIQGNLDPVLSDRGRGQASLLAHRLGTRAFASLHTSPLRRAVETATILGGGLGLPIQAVRDIREVGLGVWEGRTVSEIKGAWGEAYERWVDHPLDAPTPPGAEPMLHFQARVVGALERIRASSPDGDILVVTHGGVIRAYLCHLLGLDLNRVFRIRTDNASLTEVMAGDRGMQLLSLNDTCHLNGHGLPDGRVSP